VAVRVDRIGRPLPVRLRALRLLGRRSTRRGVRDSRMRMATLEAGSVLRPADEEIVAKVLDGEAVIINLGTGTYYSADGVGGFIWERVAEGMPVEGVAGAVVATYQVDAQRAAADLEKFLGEAIGEGLLVAEAAPSRRSVSPPASAEPRRVYEPPRLHVYRDMEELLALDPPTPGIADLRWKG
jgi:hypothetical protein